MVNDKNRLKNEFRMTNAKSLKVDSLVSQKAAKESRKPGMYLFPAFLVSLESAGRRTRKTEERRSS